MCNIAGYNGPKRAAPILIEMLKKQEIYDGGYSTGIVTIHEGKLYMRKVIGNVETLLRETDALDLPGTVGLAHSRPGADHPAHAHPHLSNSGNLALVTNGTGYIHNEKLTPPARMLEERGYTFVTKKDPISVEYYPTLSDGSPIFCLEMFVNLVEEYMKEGASFEDALLRANDEHIGERVNVMINALDPSAIRVTRHSRPMDVLIGDGECYMASTRLAFPEDVAGNVMALPVLRVCKVGRGSVEITDKRMLNLDTPEITPLTYRLVYDRVVKMLEEGEPCWDDIELAIRRMTDIWNHECPATQYAKVGYDVLWQLKCEGRLQSRLGPSEHPKYGVRTLAYMSLKK